MGRHHHVRPLGPPILTANQLRRCLGSLLLFLAMSERVDWRLLDHCGARNLLERNQWRYTAAGDWSVVLADSGGTLAARISPFERAYQYFVSLCRELVANPWLPQMHFATELEGGGYLSVTDLLTPRDLPDADAPEPAWTSTGDGDLNALRAAVDRIHTVNRATVPWWGVLDVKAGHLMLGSDSHLKLVDPFGLDGASLHAAARDDYAAFTEVIPASEHKYMMQISAFSQHYRAELLAELRTNGR